MWPVGIVVVVSGLSLAGLCLNLLGAVTVGSTLDATASGIALTVLGVGLIYSFYKYGNQLLGALAAIVFTFFITRQFVEALQGPPRGIVAVLQIASVVTLVFLFIALAVAWGLSETSRLRIVGLPTQVTVIALLFDLRGSSEWTHHVIRSDLQYAGTFIDHLRTWAWEKAVQSLKERPNLVKFLGDGFLFVWECPQDSNEILWRSRAVIDLAHSLHEEYPSWCRDNSALWRTTPRGLGIGLDVGSAIRVTFENGSEDYIGEPINDAAKLQESARPHGGVLVKVELVSRWDGEPWLLEKFPTEGIVCISQGEVMHVRATSGVMVNSSTAVVADAGHSVPNL